MNLRCISKSLLGTSSHLLFNKDLSAVSWVDEPPSNAWFFSGEIKHNQNCFDSLLKLNLTDISSQPDDRFVNMMENCFFDLNKKTIPWSKILTKHDHRAFVKNLINKMEESILTLDMNYYKSTWATGGRLLDKLEPALVDVEQYNNLLNQKVGNWRVVKTFKPNSQGICKPIIYNRFGTRTGRLTVKSGPNILTLKALYRNMLRSRYENGKIVYVDFSNLEARILLYSSGGMSNNADLYSQINELVFNNRMKRDDVKAAVISKLYGQSRRQLAKKLKIPALELDNFIDKINIFFQSDKTLEKVKQTFLENDFIYNRFNRKIKISEPLDNIFLNSYTQSTGVDVSLIGFNSLVDQVSNKRIHPLFILHDALLLDCHMGDYEYLKSIVNKGITVADFDQKFFLTCNILKQVI